MSPTSPPKLHLNENLSPRLAAELRRYGFDVTSSQEEGLLSMPDDVQLVFAISGQLSMSAKLCATHLGW